MNFLHLSDLHLGKPVHEFSMLEDQEYILKVILNIADEEKPQAVLISGDIFDRTVAPTEALRLFDDFLDGLVRRNIEAFIISGNHDSADRLAFGSRLMERSGIHISRVYNGKIVPFTISDEFGELDVFLLPFLKPVQMKRFYPEHEIVSWADAIRTVIEYTEIDASKRNILLAHQFVTGAETCESEEINVGGADNVDAEVFAPFDYVALGHLHGAQSIGRATIRYCGSPLKYSFSEVAHDVLEIDVRKAKSGQLTTQAVLELLETLIKQDGSKQKTEEAALKAVESEISKMDAALGKAEQENKALADLNQAKVELLSASEKTLELKTAYEEAEKHQPELEPLTAQTATERGKLSQYDELDATGKVISEKNEQLKALVEKKGELAESIRLNKEQQKAWNDELFCLKDAETQRLQLEAEQEKAKSRKIQLESLSSLLSERAKIESAYETAQAEYRKLRDAAKAANISYMELNRAFLDAQAGILAGTLEDGVPCPVCGSKEHPVPAELSNEAPTEKAVETAKKKADRTQSDASNASAAAAREKGKLESKDKEIEKAAKDLFTERPEKLEEGISAEIAQISESMKTLFTGLEAAKNRCKRKAEIESNLPNIEKEVTDLATAMAENETAIATVSTERKGLVSTLIKLKAALAFSTKAEAEANIQMLVNKKKQLETNISATKEALDKHKALISGLETQIQTLTRQLEGTEAINADKLVRQKIELLKQKKEHADKLTAIASLLSANTGMKERIDERLKEEANIEERLKWVKALSDTASGQLAGKDKIMLETFVQASYFERIIRRANIRLMIMSSGQYELKCAADASNQRSQSGLELNVIDHYNASERSVKTLSGGESFMASLSLALGLSDEIQSASGGIRLDTMFVDEGFGSLDQDALSQALKVLNGLADSNLLVGIISHVSELKERIDKQIIVKKEKSGGSRVEIMS